MKLIGLLFCVLLTVGLYAKDSPSFNYDKTLSLDVQEHEVAVRNGVRVSLLSFLVTPGERAGCLLVTPWPLENKSGAIVWMHSSGYFMQLPDAILMAQVGAVSLLINPTVPDWDASEKTWPDAMIQSVTSIRRGVDFLLARKDIDPKKLGFVGHSYGALMGVDAAAVDGDSMLRFSKWVFPV